MGAGVNRVATWPWSPACSWAPRRWGTASPGPARGQPAASRAAEGAGPASAATAPIGRRVDRSTASPRPARDPADAPRGPAAPARARRAAPRRSARGRPRRRVHGSSAPATRRPRSATCSPGCARSRGTSANVTDDYGPSTTAAVRASRTSARSRSPGTSTSAPWTGCAAMTRDPDRRRAGQPAPRQHHDRRARSTRGARPAGRCASTSRAARSAGWSTARCGGRWRCASARRTPRPARGCSTSGWKSRDHVSKLYDSAMPFAMFFSGGQAVHYSSDFAARGYAGASHGCVNVRDRAGIEWLFDQVVDRRQGRHLLVLRSGRSVAAVRRHRVRFLREQPQPDERRARRPARRPHRRGGCRRGAPGEPARPAARRRPDGLAAPRRGHGRVGRGRARAAPPGPTGSPTRSTGGARSRRGRGARRGRRARAPAWSASAASASPTTPATACWSCRASSSAPAATAPGSP